MTYIRLLVISISCILSLNALAGTPINVVELLEVSYSSPPDVTPKPTVTTKQLTKIDGIVENGVFKSAFHGFQLKIPSVAGSTQIRVIHSLVSRRPDGSPITGNVMFFPNDSYGASALVVTRLRDDRPKSSEYILAQFTPQNEAALAKMEEQGVSYKQISTLFGTTLQRSIKNSRISQYFPYKVTVGAVDGVNTVGISRFAVIGDFLCEFVVIADSRYVTDVSKLQSAAEAELDSLMSYLVKVPQLP